MKKVNWLVVAAGLVVGAAAVLLTALGNPGNMGFCIACFLRDTSGALGLHSAGVVQYIRPEIIGIVLGSLIAALGFKEFKGRGGSSPALRFVLGMFVMVGALMFLGCPLRMMIRIGGGALNAIVGLVGFVVGIFIGTLFELFGFQAITTNGHTIALPAPLSDVNAAISLGCLSYGVILVGGIVANGAKGAGKALKDFSLPLSMSFRLFGALLSGLLVTELVYYYVSMSFVLPVIIAVLFTMLHALIQAYVLTTLTSMFYGESTEKHAPKPKKSKKIKNIQTVNN